MKTILFGEAARDSGSLGFSEAWPLRAISLTYTIVKMLCSYHPAQTACTPMRSAISTMSSTLA